MLRGRGISAVAAVVMVSWSVLRNIFGRLHHSIVVARKVHQTDIWRKYWEGYIYANGQEATLELAGRRGSETVEFAGPETGE